MWFKLRKKYINLREAARISGYSSDYIGYLVRKGKIEGKRVYTNASWQISSREIVKYCRKNNLDIRDRFLLKKKLLSLKEAAQISDYAPDYIGYLIRERKILGKKVNSGPTWLTTAEEIKNYLEKSTVKNKKSIIESIQEQPLAKLVYDIFPPEKIQKATREITGWKPYQTKWEKIFALGWRLVLVTAILFLLIGVGPTEIFQKIIGAFTEETKTVNFYSTLCEGIWQNPKNVEGEPNISADGDFNSFSEANSAVYQGGSLNLVCQNFKTTIEKSENNIEQPKTEEQQTQQIEEQQETSEEEIPLETVSGGEISGGEASESQPAEPETSNEIPIESETKTESPTSLLENIKKFFVFQKTKAQQIPTFEELQNFQFQSAKIKFSFAIGEKKPDLEIPQSLPEESAPVIPGESASLIPEESTPPSSEQPAPTEEKPLPIEQPQNIETPPEVVPLPESVSPPAEGTEPEVIPSENTTPNEEDLVQPPQETETKPEKQEETPKGESSPTSFLEKIKNFFGSLTINAQEEILPIETVTPSQEGIVKPTETAENGSPLIETITQPTEGVQEILPNIDAKIIIWYSLDNEVWFKLDTISSYPLSNFSNGGYFSYDAPFLKDWEDVKNLKIKFEGVVGGETVVTAYLDSVWVEVNYQEKIEKIEQPKKIFKIKIKDNSLVMPQLENSFSINEEPTFVIAEPELPIQQIIDTKKGEVLEEIEIPKTQETEKSLLENVKEKILEPIIDLVAPEVGAQAKNIKTKIFGPDGTEINIPPTINSISRNGKEESEIKIPKQNEREFRPGVYKLEIEFETKDAIYVLEQDFAWGVLAVNTNKSIYLPQETAYLQMAVLDNLGHTICDANLELKITSPSGEQFSADIQKSGECGSDNVTNKPDYLTYYQVGEVGKYEMKLTNLDNGYEITDSFEVRESVPFDIERIGPTRIYPPATYQITLKIKANQDFVGEIVETVPASFEIIETSDKRQETRNEEKLIIWDVDWKAGESYELKYQFDAPDISPYSYLLGPLIISNKQQETIFQEARQWQIAADATATLNNPTVDGYADYYSSDDIYSTDTTSTSIKIARSTTATTTDRGYVEWDVTSIPDGSDVTDTVFQYNGKANAADAHIHAMASQPSVSTAQTIYNDCADGTIYADVAGFPVVGTGKSIDLGTTADSNLEAALTNNWFAIGIQLDSESATKTSSIYSEEYVGVNPAPTLYVTYTAGGITISGTIYSDEGTTAYPCNTDNLTVRVKVNGAGDYSGTCTLATGAYSVSSVPISVADDVVTVFLDNETPNAVTVTRAADITSPIGLDLYQNRLIVRHEGATSITNTNLAQYDKDLEVDGDIFFDSDLSGTYNLIVDATYKILVWTGKTFAPGGNVTTPAMRIMGTSATYSAGSSTLTLNGTGTNTSCTNGAGTVMPLCLDSGGVFTANTSTTTFTGDGDTYIAATTYNILNLTPTLTAGLDRNYTATGAITINSNLTINPSAASLAILSFSLGGTTIVTGTTNITRTSSAASILYTNNYSFTTGNLTIADTIWVEMFCGSSTVTVTNSGTPFSLGASSIWLPSTSTFVYTGTSATNITATTYYNLGVGTTVDLTAVTYSLAGATVVNNALTIGNTDSTGNDTLTTTGTNYALTAASINITSKGILTANGSIVTITGSGTPFTISGTFTYGASTVNYTATTATNVAATTYYSLGVGTTVDSTAVTYSLAGATVANNALTIGNTDSTGNDTLTTTGTNYALTAASINITSKGILTANGSIVTITYFSGTPFTVSGTFNYGASTLIFNGDGPITIASTTYYNLTLSPAITTSRIYTGGGAITVNNNLNISIYSETIPAPTFTFNLGGATSVSGVLTIESLLSSYVVLNTTNGNYSLTMGSLSIQLHGTLTGNASALDSNGDVTIAATGTLTSTSGNFNVAGNWSNSGTFTHSSGTVIFDAGAGSKTIASGGSNFYNVTFNNAAGGWSFSDATTIAHDLVMTAGTLSQTSDLTLTVNGDLKGTAGAINYTNGTAKQTVAADKNFGPTTASTNWTFKNLTFSNSSASDRTITVQSCATCGVTVSSVLTIGEAANSNLTILSAGDKTWTLSGTGTPFVITATKGQFTASTSTVKYTGNGATNITVATYNNLEFSPSIDDDRIYTGAGAITVGGTLNINPSATAKSLTFLLGGITSVTGATTIQTTSTATSILDTKSGNDYTFNTGSLTIKAGGTLNGRASTLDSNGDVTIEASGTLIAPSSSGSFNIGGSWSNSATGVFTHSSGTVTFDATTTGKTISDGGDPFYNIVFNGSGGGWIYQDGTDGINQTTVSNGTVIYLNTKTGTQPVSVTGGTLNVDWYLGVLVVDASNTNTKINTGDNDITISENSTTPASTIWEWSGSDWDSPASSKTIGTDSDGIIPSPGTNGAIRIREYSNTSGSPTYYKYNLAIVWQSTYGEYNYYTDYGQNYITSTANTGSGEDEVIDNDYKRTTPTNQNIPEQAVNKPPTNGSWYVGMFKGLEVTIAGTSIDFGTLDAPNFSATAGTKTNITVTTSATSGYIVTAWEDGLMKCSDSIDTIQNFTGSYADPREWSGYCKDNTDYCGFGFTSSDPSVGVVNPSRYSGATAYTFFPTDSSAPVLVMDFDGPVASQSYLITYRISASLTQRPGFYSTTIVYIVTAQY